MGVAGQHVHSLDAVAAHLVLQHFVRADLPLLDEPMAGYDDEELPLGIMPVLALGNAGLTDFDREPAMISSL